MTEILEQLEINSTFFYQFILFGIFFFILSSLYLKPFQKLLAKREQKLKGDVESASELLKKVELRLKDYESALANARAEALKSYEQVLSEARSLEELEINAVKDLLKKDFAAATSKLQDDRLKIESELKLQVEQLSGDLARRLTSGK